MWTIIKFEKKKIGFLKEEIKKTFGEGAIIYSPKLLIKRFKKNKLYKRELNILGDYLFCYHRNFKDTVGIKRLNFLKGVKYFLNGFHESQNEINEFILRCRRFENESGYISQSLYSEKINKYYKFADGPFANKIFKIIDLQKKKIDILIGNLKTTINKKEFLYSPI
tara:strand:- start:629 stop:1126 length:498 start_codon:yes stop_codon:yes gene_type:complete